ncbi:MAG: sugar kinase [Lachnospiraceae bacterium]|nr:sugar kinase [Lachnospiraceae bacterium]
MAEVWIMGEMIVEIMRDREDVPLDQPGYFRGPYPSGAPAIFIDTVARLGHSAGIIGGVGKDDFGKCLLTRLQGDGVDVRQVLQSETCATGAAFVTYFSNGDRKFIFHMGNTPAADAKAPEATVLDGVKYFHIMGCSLAAKKEFGEEILKTMHLAVEKGGKVSFDPNIRKELLNDSSSMEMVKDVVANTSVFLPGVEELLMITGRDSVEEAVEYAFAEYPKLEILALKRGSKGCRVYTKERVLDMGIYRVESVDATGAGDSFDGAFISGLLEEKSLDEIVKMAAAAGALNTAAFGPMEGKINPDTIREMIEANE